MNPHRFIRPFRFLASGSALLTLLLLAGCENQKIVARVNTEPITEEEFTQRALRLTSTDLPASMDVGAATLISMIREKLTTQYASEKNLNPSKEDVTRFTTYARRRNPPVDKDIKEGRRDEEDLNRQARFSMQELAIGTEGGKVDQAKIEAEFARRKDQFKVPELLWVRLLPVSSEAQGAELLPDLKKTGDFKAAARKAGYPPTILANVGKEAPLFVTTLDPASRTELSKLNPGQYTEKTLAIVQQNPQTGQTQQTYVIGQLVRKEKEYEPKVEDVRFLIQSDLLVQQQPNWQEHKNAVMAEFTRKAEIQINVKRYAYLLDYIKAQTEMNAAPTPAGMGSAPSAAPGGASAPPSSSGGSPVPSGGTGTPGAK